MKRFLPIVLLFLLVACEKDEKMITYDLTTEINPSEGGSIRPSNIQVEAGEEINLTATPAEGYYFKNWSGDISSTENPIKLIINSDKTITAVFEKTDNDEDGIPDDIDQCPETAEGELVDIQGCSESQKDADQDGIQDNADICPETPESETVDENGCSESQKDTDDDGVTDDLDLCSETPGGEIVDEQGCSDSQKDSDNDGVSDNLDQCPDTPESETADENGCTLSLKTYIPDDEFEQFLINLGYDDVLDDYVVTTNISSIEAMRLASIKDLTGLKAFVSLNHLLMTNVLDHSYALNTSDFPSLKKLYFEYCELKSVEINENSILEVFDGGVTLDTFSVTNNSSITNISFGDFGASNSALISGNSNLISFFSGISSFDELTLTDNPSLREISFWRTKIDNFNVSNNSSIESFTARMSGIPLNLSSVPSLKEIELENAWGIIIDLSSNSSLERLHLIEMYLDKLDVSHNNALKDIAMFDYGADRSICVKVNQQQFDNIPSGWTSFGTTMEYSLDCPD